MDIRLFAAVMSRFKKMAIGGLVVAVLLAGLAYKRAGGTPLYNAQAEVLITQSNDPYGGPTTGVLQEGSYLSGLANVYAAITNGDPVQAMIRKAAGVPTGAVNAAEVVDPPTGNVDPLITLTSSAGTPEDAVKLAQSTPRVLQQYISREQAAANVPKGSRVLVSAIKRGVTPELASSTSVTVPLLVFMGVMGAVITLIFMRENLDPRTAERLGRVQHPAGAGATELATVLATLVQSAAPSSTAPAPADRTSSELAENGVASLVHPHAAAVSNGSAGDVGAARQHGHGPAPIGEDPQPPTLRHSEEAMRAAADDRVAHAAATIDPGTRAPLRKLARWRG